MDGEVRAMSIMDIIVNVIILSLPWDITHPHRWHITLPPQWHIILLSRDIEVVVHKV
jgi:hypothetical protein